MTLRFNFSNACSRYGASMGRPNTRGKSLPTVPRSLYLQRVRVDSQGHDPGGAYWGLGEQLWVAFDESGELQFFARASNRNNAKTAVRRLWPLARFYR